MEVGAGDYGGTVWMIYGSALRYRLKRYIRASVRRQLIGEKRRRQCVGRRGFRCFLSIWTIRETAWILGLTYAV